MKAQSHYSFMAPEEKAIRFFQETKRALGITSTRKLARIISRIFGTVRKSLTYQEMKYLISAIPGLLQLQVAKEWRYQEKPVTLEHLDQLVDTICEEEEKSSQRLFRSEIEILNAVIIIMQKLDKMIGLLNFPGFRFSLVQEIRQVPLEDAA